MATVRETISLQDRMSPVLRSIVKALGSTVTAMESVDKSSSKALKAAMRDANAAAKAVEDFSNKTDELPEKGKKAGQSMGDWKEKIVAANQALQLFTTGLSLAKSAASWIGGFLGEVDSGIATELQLAVVMGNQDTALADYQRVLDKAAAMQQSTMYSKGALVGGAGELATYLKDDKALTSAMDVLADYAAGMSAGASVNESQMIEYATQLGKAFDGQMDGLAKKGFAVSDAQKQILETGTDMERVAVINDIIAESWDGLADAYAKTPFGKMEQFRNLWADTKEQVGAQLYPAILQLIDVLIENLPTIEMIMTTIGHVAAVAIGFISDYLIPAIVSGFEWLRENAEAVKSAMIILGAVVAGVALAMAISWLVANWPILLIIVAIFALISVLDTLGVESDEVLSFVGGLFGMLFGHIQNVVAGLYNIFIAFAEFFANFMNDPIGSVMRLFFNLFDVVMSILQSIAGAVDSLFNLGWSDAIQGFRDNVKGWASDTFGEAEIKFDRMGEANIPEMFEAGQRVGKDISNALDDMGKGLEGLDMEKYFGGAAGGGNPLQENGRVGSVGSIEDEVSISEEDIKMLKDIAGREYQLNYAQLTPQFSAVFGDVRETADVTQVLNTMVAWGNESLASSLSVG